MTAQSSQQMSLEGFAPSLPTDRLFFALFPDVAARDTIAILAREVCTRHALRGAPLRADRFHVTLHHLGDHAGLPRNVVNDALRAADGTKTSGFDVVFDRVESFAVRRDKKPCVLLAADGDSPLRSLQKLLGDHLIAAGLGKYIERNFKPHVTLCYDQALVPAHPVASIGWSVREFILVHSLLGQTEHRILGRWPLQA